MVDRRDPDPKRDTPIISVTPGVAGMSILLALFWHDHNYHKYLISCESKKII